MNEKTSPPKVKDFFAAVREGNLKRANEKLKDGVDINSKDYEDPDVPTALIEACKGNDVNMVKGLLSFKSKRADVNADTASGRRPIW